MPTLNRAAIFALLTSALAANAATTTAPTDAGRILKDNPPPSGAPPAAAPPRLQAPAAPETAIPAGAEDVKVDVATFKFTGNTVISTAILEAAVSGWTGKSLSFGDLVQVTEKIETIYREAGYFLAQAVLPPQQIRSGVITIAITEGRLGKTRLEGESRVKPDVLYQYLDRIPAGEVVTESALDRPALLINDLAGISASLDLQASETPGATDAVLVQRATPLFTGRATLDNHGLPTTGEYRLGVSAALNSPLNLGDRLAGSVMLSNTGNLHTYSLRYDLPLGGDGWRLHLAKSRAQYNLGGAFSALDASGTADSWRAGVSYPWLRSRKANLQLQLETDYSRLRDVIGSQALTLGKHSYGLTFTPTFDWQDDWLGGGGNQVSLELRHGQLDLGSDAKLLDLPPVGPDTDGSFSKIALNLFRQQTISKQVVLNAQWKQQFASDNLDSSEKISIGGPQNLVAYPVSQATADEGGFGKLELRWQALQNLSVGAFAEYARLKLLHNSRGGDNHAVYRDFGLDARWRMHERLDFNAVVAWAGHESPNPGDNDRPRIWANLGYSW